MIYAQQAYAKVQAFENPIRYEGKGISLSFEVENNCAISLPKSPAGGIAIGEICREKFLAFYKNVELSLKNANIQSVEITLPIGIYPRPQPAWLLELGYTVTNTEIAHYLPLTGNFEEGLHTMQRRKLKKLGQVTYKFAFVTELSEIYKFIKNARQAEGIPLNISLELLAKLFRTFPESYHIHTAQLQGEMVAACITVVPSEHVTYYFLPATAKNARAQSPMVGLLAHMHSYYQNRGFEFIDLGISSEHGVPQASLITFKERLGGVRTERLTFRKVL